MDDLLSSTLALGSSNVSVKLKKSLGRRSHTSGPKLSIKVSRRANGQSTSSAPSVETKVESPTANQIVKVAQERKTTPKIVVQQDTQPFTSIQNPEVFDESAWISTFKEENPDKNLSVIPETTTDARKVAEKLGIDLNVETVKCIGSTNKGCRCTYNIAKANATEARIVIGRLQTSDPILESRYLAVQLEILAGLLLCKRYHQKQNPLFTAKWNAILQGPARNSLRAREEHTPAIDRQRTPRPSRTNGKKRNPKYREVAKVATSTTATSTTATSTTATSTTATTKTLSVINEVTTAQSQVTNPTSESDLQLLSTRIETQFSQLDAVETCIRTLIPFDAKAKSRVCTDDYVKGTLRKDLSSSQDQRSGLIYIYWFEGNFGHVKIGVTTRTPEERLQEWAKKCGHKPKLIFPKPEDDRTLVPHVYRVETLVQAQLRNCRKKELKCRKCGTCHREWFESSVPEAIALVKKWSAWMRTNPYEPVSTDDDYKQQGSQKVWRLKRSQTKKIHSLCQLQPEDQKRRVSTSQLKERTARLSVSPQRRRRAMSEEPPRRSVRLAEKQRSTSISRSDASRATPDLPIQQ
ncbi:MAG: hypothetical protein Q9218_005486 [Villophora microphyllina]